MSLFRNHPHRVPGLNTASLPDLIFTVLFFFMIVTQMRSVPVKVRFNLPSGTELTKLVKKSSVTYIYIGKPLSAPNGGKGAPTRIQLNDKYAGVDDIADYITDERNGMSPADVKVMSVSIKADKHTDMGTIIDVKQALRKANVYRINYSAVKR